MTALPGQAAPALLIGWTTCASPEDARRLAEGVVTRGLAVCVQIDGPVTSVYRWKGAVETAAEHRLTLKFVPEQQVELERWLRESHPYETPEWVVVGAATVAEKYLSWARETGQSLRF
jgi:periplasmic divalent cation tolerance protein